MQNEQNTITVKNHKLSAHPKKGDLLVGGKTNGYTITKITKTNKFYGVIISLYLYNPTTQIKRIVNYTPQEKQITDFKKGFLTATKGTYYMTWD